MYWLIAEWKWFWGHLPTHLEALLSRWSIYSWNLRQILSCSQWYQKFDNGNCLVILSLPKSTLILASLKIHGSLLLMPKSGFLLCQNGLLFVAIQPSCYPDLTRKRGRRLHQKGNLKGGGMRKLSPGEEGTLGRKFLPDRGSWHWSWHVQDSRWEWHPSPKTEFQFLKNSNCKFECNST